LSRNPPEAGTGTRELRLAGADNVRDLGGLPTRDRAFTRSGRLFRGELMPSLVEADVELLIGKVGLNGVVDLRTRGEVKHNPGRWLEHGVAWVHCPFRLGESAPVPGPGVDYVAAYLGFLDSGPRPVVFAAATLMNPEFHPALFHCAAGKDRTGVLSALLLDAIGVTPEAIASDYAMTAGAFPQVFERLRTMEPYWRSLSGTVAADHEAREETMIAFLSRLWELHGGAAAWLLAHGLVPELLEVFRRTMLVA
jgi:protein-tyrosine phosphatase